MRQLLETPYQNDKVKFSI